MNLKIKELRRSVSRSWRLKRLQPKSLHSSGVNEIPLVVSLTSIPSRLRTVHLTIRSLLAQTHKPEKVVLWLHESLRESLPKSLSLLVGKRFDVRFGPLTCPHRKLVCSLIAFPNKTIVTADDDVMYDSGWLKNLHDEHLRYPKSIVANQCRFISCDAHGQLSPYSQWETEPTADIGYPSILAIGFAGVLYPPKSLHADAISSELFLKLAPTNDDLWFKAMALRQGTETRRANQPSAKPCTIAGSQRIALKKVNVRQDGNQRQWSALNDYYGFSKLNSETVRLSA